MSEAAVIDGIIKIGADVGPCLAGLDSIHKKVKEINSDAKEMSNLFKGFANIIKEIEDRQAANKQRRLEREKNKQIEEAKKAAGAIAETTEKVEATVAKKRGNKLTEQEIADRAAKKEELNKRIQAERTLGKEQRAEIEKNSFLARSKHREEIRRKNDAEREAKKAENKAKRDAARQEALDSRKSDPFLQSAMAMRGSRGMISAMYSMSGTAVGAGAIAGIAIASGLVIKEAYMGAISGLLDLSSASFDIFLKSSKAVIGIVGEIMEAGGAVERQVLRLKMLGRMSQDNAMGVIKDVQEIVKFTPYMEAEVLKLATSLTTVGAYSDKFLGKTLTLTEAVSNGMSTVDADTLKWAGSMKISATSALMDYAAATGNVGARFNQFVVGMTQFLSTGKIKRLEDNIDIRDLKRLKDAMKMGGGKTVVDEMQRITQERGWLGYGAAASTTWDGIISNFKELPQIIMRSIANFGEAGGPFDVLKKALIDVYMSIGSAVQDPKFLENVREIAKPFLEGIGDIAKMAGNAVKAIGGMIKTNPEMLTFALNLGKALFVTGPLITSITALAGAIGLLLPVIKMVAEPIIGVIAAITGLDRAGSMLTKFSVILKGLGELLSTWKYGKGQISIETFSQLEEFGIKDIFSDIAERIHAMSAAMEQAKFVAIGWNEVYGGQVVKSIEALLDSIYELLQVMGFDLPKVTGDSLEQGKDKYGSFSRMIVKSSEMIISVIDGITGAIRVLAAMIDYAFGPLIKFLNTMEQLQGSYKLPMVVTPSVDTNGNWTWDVPRGGIEMQNQKAADLSAVGRASEDARAREAEVLKLKTYAEEQAARGVSPSEALKGERYSTGEQVVVHTKIELEGKQIAETVKSYFDQQMLRGGVYEP